VYCYVNWCKQNQKRVKLMLTAFDKHNRLMAEAQDGHGTQFTRRSIVLIHHLLSQTKGH